MDEILDVLDESGDLTGEIMPRKDIQQSGKWHKAAHVWIINSKNELLITRRSLNANTSPGAWTMSAGGHVAAGESSFDCAKRELAEEVGVDLPKNKFKYLFTTKFRSGDLFPGKNVNQFNDVFLVEADIRPDQVKPDLNEVIDVKYINYKKLQEQITKDEIEMTPQYEQFDKLFAYISSSLE